MIKNYKKIKWEGVKFMTLLLALCSIVPLNVSAQMVQQIESFESTTLFPAPGWRQQKYVSNVNGAFVLQPAASATNPVPVALPGGGLNLMMFNSFVGTNNDTAIIITKPFDFSNNSGVNPQFSFAMYRDNGFSAQDDHIRVYINTVPSMSGATLLTNTLGVNKLSRYSATAPAAVPNSWNTYTYDLAAATYTAKRYYFIFMGVCKDGNNIYMDRVTTNTYPSATLASDVNFNLFLQNGASVGTGINNHMIVGIRCIVAGTSGCGVVNAALSTAVKLDSLLLNTNGTTNVLNIDDAKIYYTGGSVQFDTTYVTPFPVTAGSDDYPSKRYGSTIPVPGTNLDFINAGTSCFYLEYDTTYFWLTYDIKPTATGGNFVDADLRGAAAGGTPGTCPSPGATGIPVVPDPGGFSLAGASQIDLPYCVGSYTVGTSWLNGSYTNNDFVQSVVLNGDLGTVINTNFGATNNNAGLPSNLPCLVANGGSGCDFTAHPPDYELWAPIAGRTVVITQGTARTVTVQAGTWVNSNHIAVFIDYNRDGDFADAGEKLGQVNLAANQSQGINFTVPAIGYTGVTRMRVREVWSNSNIDPCSQYTYGEIEDFSIIISPSCPLTAKLWLGNTDDWNNPGNWCGGIPTYLDSAVVDRSRVFPGAPTRRYFPPTIKSNVAATADILTISTVDTLLINAPTPALNPLKLRRDLVNNGRIMVISSFTDDMVFSNGTLPNNIYTPFKSQSTDARSQIIYSAAELTLKGMVNGDNIDGVEYSLWFKGSSAAYNGLIVSYALVPFTQHANNIPYAGALTTVYGPSSYSTALGLNTIPFTTPIVWDGSSSLLIQYCFDNSSNIGSNDDRIYITQTTGIKSTLILSTTSNANVGCSLTPGAGVSDNFFSGLSSYRPNFTLLVNRPYVKTNIYVREDWVNNGVFVGGLSRVIMDSSIVSQTIGGTQTTTFTELQLNKGSAAQTVTMLRNVIIDSSLILSQGSLLLNAFTLTMNNPALNTGNLLSPQGPFVRTNGFLISENASSLVILKNINTSLGYRVVPFGNAAVASPIYIPFSFTTKGGDMGDLSVSTYNAVGNVPWPPGVTHFNPATGAGNNAAAAVDRFWMLSKTGANPVADVIFRFTILERAPGMSAFNLGKAQPWRTQGTNNAWIRLIIPYTSATYTQNYGQVALQFDSLRVINWDWPTLPIGPAPFLAPSGPVGNSNPWAITLNATPLPVELLNFDAKLINKKVRLSWTTASEVNNDYFTVERADKNLDQFNFIAKVNSYMNNSSVMLNYETWDEHPMKGMQYYRLKQTDFDGAHSYSDIKPVYIGTVKAFEITNVYGHTQSDGQFQVEFIYDSELPLTAHITDATGRLVYSESNIAAAPGLNRIELSQSLAQGLYFIILQNQESKVSYKFFY